MRFSMEPDEGYPPSESHLASIVIPADASDPASCPQSWTLTFVRVTSGKLVAVPLSYHRHSGERL
jgi:hypothetical protein